ncbi:cation:proton antiporter [Gephyromycinifex aptenodytis]|uniref:cation:proton antiporter n=1 Tax=Gephyromycinifex aptenodytis TaxID=2716227 RepID=UPI00144730C5|nr:cation:proton antiporter [Gephyromycinifex aptenodytis]
MDANALYLVVGVALLLAVVLPTLLERVALSAPMVLVGTGLAVSYLPVFGGEWVSPLAHPAVTERAAELCVIVALMGVGLAIDRPLAATRASLRAWRSTWSLLLIAMPLCIACVALLGWWAMGITPAAALLLGASLAPTDPVLAADVQVSGPTAAQDEPIDEQDEVRFALTSEGGLNDALAFPFVYAAIYLIQKGPIQQWWLEWLSWELFGKVLIGLFIGYISGWLIGALSFRSRSSVLRFAEQGEPLVALSATLGVYGLTELIGGWGFLAVFVAALRLRAVERNNRYHAVMHEMVERLERLLTLLLLLMLGLALGEGLLAYLPWQGALVGLALIFIIRPATAWLALGRQSNTDTQGDQCLGPRERIVTAFFGVRGIGSVYYLAYALQRADFPHAEVLWSVVGFTILVSVIVHGISATPVMHWLERIRERPDVEEPGRM